MQTNCVGCISSTRCARCCRHCGRDQIAIDVNISYHQEHVVHLPQVANRYSFALGQANRRMTGVPECTREIMRSILIDRGSMIR